MQTAKYTKETDAGECLNYWSITPEKYKIATIKTFLHRARKVCSTRTAFDSETVRLKKLLSNNNYPMSLINDVVEKFIEVHMREDQVDDSREKITLLFRGQMTSHYKQDEQSIKKIIRDHVLPVNENEKVYLQIFYKN